VGVTKFFPPLIVCQLCCTKDAGCCGWSTAWNSGQ
jgi:hypothetical protein